MNKLAFVATLAALAAGCTTTEGNVVSPVSLDEEGDRVVQLDGDEMTMCAVTEQGAVLCWGDRYIARSDERAPGGYPSSVLEYEDYTSIFQEQPVALAIADALEVVVADHTACAIRRGGGVSCWGWVPLLNPESGTGFVWYEPTEVPGLNGVEKLLIEGRDMCALDGAGTLRCSSLRRQAEPVEALTVFARDVADAALSEELCVLDTAGTTACFLPEGEEGFRRVLVETPEPLVELFALASNVCGRTAAGETFCWGYQGLGLSEDDPFEDRAEIPGTEADHVPVRIAELDGLEPAAYGSTICATGAGGAVLCSSANLHGELMGVRPLAEDWPETNVTPFVELPFRALDLAVNDGSVCGIGDDGVSCWGTWKSHELEAEHGTPGRYEQEEPLLVLAH